MGTVYQATCPCGFEQTELMQGCGYSGPDVHYDIIGCPHCHILYSQRGGEDRNHYEPAHYKKCQREAIRYMGQLEDKKHSCPNCGKNVLAFYQTGLWD